MDCALERVIFKNFFDLTFPETSRSRDRVLNGVVCKNRLTKNLLTVSSDSSIFVFHGRDKKIEKRVSCNEKIRIFLNLSYLSTELYQRTNCHVNIRLNTTIFHSRPFYTPDITLSPEYPRFPKHFVSQRVKIKRKKKETRKILFSRTLDIRSPPVPVSVGVTRVPLPNTPFGIENKIFPKPLKYF